MIRFLKTHWFTVALAVILLAALARRHSHFIPKENASVKAFTDGRPEKERPAALALFGGGRGSDFPEITPEHARGFIKRFTATAQAEQKKFRIPASVILGVAMVNSGAGQRAAAVQANNYFLLPCDESWDGSQKVIDGRCRRQYESAWASFRDFSIFLTAQDWFGALRQSAGKDWRGWVSGLEGKNLSDVRDFEKVLEKVIDDYRLYSLD